MRLEREKKARKQAARDERERQEAEERQRQEEQEIAEQARRLQEEQRVSTENRHLSPIFNVKKSLAFLFLVPSQPCKSHWGENN